MGNRVEVVDGVPMLVKDAIIDFCETLQLDRQFDVSWLVDLDLTPIWIKEYAVKIETQTSSLHPQKDTD